MPEGDTIFRAAATLHRALAGEVVTRFATVLPKLARVDEDRPIAGRTVLSAEAAGKHLLLRFSGDLVLRTHMRMSGSWHLYRPGERWRRPRAAMRIVVETAPFVAVGFDVPEAELLDARGVARHRALRALGPDLLAPEFDAAEATRRIRSRPEEAVGDAVLNQRALAGAGNVFKSEILFVAGVNPFRPVASLSAEELDAVLAIARRLLRANVGERAGPGAASAARRTTGRVDPSARRWVYGRGGEACRRCGDAVRFARQGRDARGTYWCPTCQPERGGAERER
jgi:endonuclease VIII